MPLIVIRATQIINTPTPDTDWTRFDEYAWRVRDLTCVEESPSRKSYIPGSVFATLGNRKEALFPNLCVLSLFISDGTVLNLFKTIPNTLYITCVGCRGQRMLQKFLGSSTGPTSLGLEHLSVQGCRNESYPVHLSACTQLRSIELKGLGSWPKFSMYAALSSLKRLVKLDLHIASSGLGPFESTGGFEILEELIVHGEVTVITNVLYVPLPSTLRSISFVEDVHNPGTKQIADAMQEWRVLFNKLTHRLRNVERPFSLTVSRMAHCHDATDSSDRPSLLSVLDPLLAWTPYIKVLDFVCFPHMPLSDMDVAKIAVALPNIETLDLPFSFGGKTDLMAMANSRPTMAALVILAEHCPNLTALSLSIDTQDLASVTLPAVSSHGLDSWSVGPSVLVCEPIVLAGHVDRLFPRLRRLERGSGVESPMWRPDLSKDWINVLSVVEILRALRDSCVHSS